MKIYKNIAICFLILFFVGLFLELPMTMFVIFNIHETFIATLDTVNKIMEYKFLPISLIGQKEILKMYFFYIPFPTAISLLLYLVFNKKYKNTK